MEKRKNKSSQKKFMQTMIITGVVGLSIMMIVMLYMVKLFGQKKAVIVPESSTSVVGNKDKEDRETEQLRGVVRDIGNKRKNIKVWDIEEKQEVKVYIKEKTQITDSYGKPMSIQEVGLGDIVQITYDARKKDILTIQKSAKAWTKSEVLGIDLNTQSKTIKIGNVKYGYTSDIVIINDELELVDISDINSLDTLMIQGIDDTIWSMQVVQSAGYLKLSNIPTRKGTIEIGNNKIYRLEEIEDQIALPGGEHKIVIRMEGYHPLVKHIIISTKQIQELDLKDVEAEVANLKIKVVNTEVDYRVNIGGKTYKKDELIQVKSGQYTLKVAAEGFEVFEMEIQLVEGDRSINVTLQAKNEDPTAGAGEQKLGQENTVPQSPAPQNPTPVTPKPEAPPVEEIKTVQIIIETDPADSQVFVNGVYKGKTPALTGLKPGEYSITIEKEGYLSLYTTIIIDASNAQKGFLYTLQKE
ncbi:MAG TPA: PEGA domain-containing protein [Epulopiscium sp.]|nr:PEGA domain-containing protein [Candidatus Epulonipiscium sp.]